MSLRAPAAVLLLIGLASMSALGGSLFVQSSVFTDLLAWPKAVRVLVYCALLYTWGYLVYALVIEFLRGSGGDRG